MERIAVPNVPLTTAARKAPAPSGADASFRQTVPAQNKKPRAGAVIEKAGTSRARLTADIQFRFRTGAAP